MTGIPSFLGLHVICFLCRCILVDQKYKNWKNRVVFHADL